MNRYRHAEEVFDRLARQVATADGTINERLNAAMQRGLHLLDDEVPRELLKRWQAVKRACTHTADGADVPIATATAAMSRDDCRRIVGELFDLASAVRGIHAADSQGRR